MSKASACLLVLLFVVAAQSLRKVGTFTIGGRMTKGSNGKWVITSVNNKGGSGGWGGWGNTGGSSGRGTKPTGGSGSSGNTQTDAEFMKEALEEHNKYRAMHGAPPMKLDKNAQKVAQDWANQIAKSDRLGHNPRRGNLGENVYWSSGNRATGKTATSSWYSEVNKYDFNNQGFKSGTGHFTQVVWKGSTGLGCGKAHSRRGGTYIVCNYSPPGNMQGGYKENVSPKR